MKKIFSAKVLLVAVCSLTTACAWGQQNQGLTKQRSGQLEVAVTYDAMKSNTTSANNFWMQGGSVQVHGQFRRGLGLVGDLSILHTGNEHGSGVGLDLLTLTFGPRYTWTPAHHRYAVFGQALGGEAIGYNSVFPFASGSKSSDSDIALKIGGGVDVALARHFSVRALEADWMRTQLVNSTNNVQNNLRLGAGVVWRSH